MKLIRRMTAAIVLLVVSPLGLAAHIDELGINVSLYSSDGAGNFQLQYDEYMGADGWMWGGSSWSATYGAPLTVTESAQGASIALTSGTTIDFSGLVDSLANPVGAFGPGQINTQFVNDTSDAALYSGILDYSIIGFDPLLSYMVDVFATDCCYVTASGGPQFNNSIQFDPSIVVTSSPQGSGTVPEPAPFALMALGLLGLGVMRRRQGVHPLRLGAAA